MGAHNEVKNRCKFSVAESVNKLVLECLSAEDVENVHERVKCKLSRKMGHIVSDRAMLAVGDSPCGNFKEYVATVFIMTREEIAMYENTVRHDERRETLEAVKRIVNDMLGEDAHIFAEKVQARLKAWTDSEQVG